MDDRAAALLCGADRILILTHRRPDGDTIGCAAALCLALRQLGKTAWIFPNEDATALFTPYLEGLLAPDGFLPDFITTVDTASAGMLTASAEHYAGRVDLVLDHHGSNEHYGRVNCVDPSCAACGELVYRVILAMGAALMPEIALPLYVAVSTDTGCFVYSNTTADTHRVAAALMEVGIPYAAANKRHFRTKSLARLRLQAMLMEVMRFSHGGMVAVAPISLALMERAGAQEEDVEDIAAFVGQVDGAWISATIRELAGGEYKISLRTNPNLLNAAATCALLGGGGHPAAAGCSVWGTMEQAIAAMLDAIDRTLPAGQSTVD